MRRCWRYRRAGGDLGHHGELAVRPAAEHGRRSDAEGLHHLCRRRARATSMAPSPLPWRSGLLEACTQYVLGVRYSFALLLLLVIVVLIWRPYGSVRPTVRWCGCDRRSPRPHRRVWRCSPARAPLPFIFPARATSSPRRRCSSSGQRRHAMESGARRRRDLLAGADGVVCRRRLCAPRCSAIISICRCCRRCRRQRCWRRLLVSVLIGLACLRLRGPYVALLTLAVAQVIFC